MRVLLILPSGGRSLCYPSLGLGYLAAVLMQKGHEAKVMDFELHDAWCSSRDGYSLTIANGRASATRSTTDSKAEFVPDISHLGQLLAQAMREYRPHLVGIHVHSGNAFLAIRAAQWLVERGMTVVLGGPEATDHHQFLLERIPGLFGVVRGEGESALGTIVEHLVSSTDPAALQNVPGFSFLHRGQILSSPPQPANITSLPFPQWDAFDLEGYRRRTGALVLPAQLARGCASRCRFCSISHLQTYRRRSVESFVQELADDIVKLGACVFRFGDSTFNSDRLACLKVCTEISRLPSAIRWGAYARVDNIDDEVAAAMRNSGCHYLYLGIESGNDVILRLMRKRTDRNAILRAVDSLRRHGVKILCSFMVGFPGESSETLDDTCDLIRRIQPDAGLAFPFEARDHTEVLASLATFGPNELSSVVSGESASVAEEQQRRGFVCEYGRLLPREFVRWQDTNMLMDWLGAVDGARRVQAEIDRYARYRSEAELLADAAMQRPTHP